MANKPTFQELADWLPEGQVDPTDERVSIWDIRRGWRDRFWIVFSFLAVFAAMFETWFEFQFGSGPTAWHQTRSIISNTMPYIVLIGPASYLITEVIVVLSERYIEWRRRKSREALAGWLSRRQQAWDRGEIFKELFPRAVDTPTIQANLKLILALPEKPSNGSSEERPDPADLDAREQRIRDMITRERRILEVEAWYGRKRLAQDRGETFSEPFPQDKSRG